MKRIRYSIYLTEDELNIINEYALSHGRKVSPFVRYAALSEAKKHIDKNKKKNLFQRVEEIEKILLKNRI